jgi:hypothetical protein
MSDFNNFDDADSKGENTVIVDATDPSKKVKVVNSQILTSDIINTSVVNGVISVSTSQIEAKVGASRLVDRKGLWITPTNRDIYWGNTGVTTTNGTVIFKNQTYFLSIGDIPIFLIASGVTDVRIVEAS